MYPNKGVALSPSHDLRFIETIPPTRENAKAVQKLTLQDVLAGRFEEPRSLADPLNERMVTAQQKKLQDHPDRYSGYVQDGQLVAYIKQNNWLVGDELPFASGLRATALKALRALHPTSATGQWGIFGLVASDDLEVVEYTSALAGLLQRSFVDPRNGKPRTVNIVVHEHDPLLEIVELNGFVPLGELGEAAGAPGLKQQRYQRQASN